jgi:hypothetical protein
MLLWIQNVIEEEYGQKAHRLIPPDNEQNTAEWKMASEQSSEDSEPLPKPYYITREDLAAAWNRHVTPKRESAGASA